MTNSATLAVHVRSWPIPGAIGMELDQRKTADVEWDGCGAG